MVLVSQFNSFLYTMALIATIVTGVPMAITMIGGVTIFKVLTIFVALCVYFLFSKIGRKKYITSLDNFFIKGGS